VKMLRILSSFILFNSGLCGLTYPSNPTGTSTNQAENETGEKSAEVPSQVHLSYHSIGNRAVSWVTMSNSTGQQYLFVFHDDNEKQFWIKNDKMIYDGNLQLSHQL